MAALTMDFLPGELRNAAELIDQKDYFPSFEEDWGFQEPALLCRELQAALSESYGLVVEFKAGTSGATAGALHDGMYEESDTGINLAKIPTSVFDDMASVWDESAEWVKSRRAGFFKIVLIYWQQAQYSGCPNPGNLDSVLLSNSYWALENARRAWEGMVENREA